MPVILSIIENKFSNIPVIVQAYPTVPLDLNKLPSSPRGSLKLRAQASPGQPSSAPSSFCRMMVRPLPPSLSLGWAGRRQLDSCKMKRREKEETFSSFFLSAGPNCSLLPLQEILREKPRQVGNILRRRHWRSRVWQDTYCTYIHTIRSDIN